MIEFIKGTLISTSSNTITINCNGIGYKMFFPIKNINTISSKVNSSLFVWVSVIYSEKERTAFSFLTEQERDFFNLLRTKIPGCGPKSSFSLLSIYTIEQLKQIVSEDNASLLTKCPGIGKQSANKIIILLKNFLDLKSETKSSSITDIELELRTALISLGYRTKEASKKAQKAVNSNKSKPIEELITIAINEN